MGRVDLEECRMDGGWKRTTMAVVALLMLMAPSGGLMPAALADETVPPDIPAVTPQQVQDAVIKALDWYASIQSVDGGWRSSVGITSFVLMCFAGAGYDHTNRTVERGIEFISHFYDEEEGYISESFLNYDTALAIMALSSLQPPGKADMLTHAVGFQELLQFSDDRYYNQTEDWYLGGWPNHAGIPDMSNSQFAILGMYMADLYTDPDPVDPQVYGLLGDFIDYCQNWEGVNTLPWASNASLPSHNDGGFVYNGFRSRTELGEQMFESYGSITAAGVFSQIVAGEDDRQPEVAAARGWLDREYSLEVNPRVDTKGLYYYLWTQARALAMSPQDHLVDGSGNMRDWRAESADYFMDLQYATGGFPGNPFIGWREEEPEIAGVYALLTMMAGYLLVPDPALQVTVTGAEDVSFITLDGEVLRTDPTRGVQVSGGTLTCTDPELFRKLWVDMDGAQGTRATVTATGTWGEGRESEWTEQVELGPGGGSAFIATGGFAGPFGIHITGFDGGPAFKVVSGERVKLTRGETKVVKIGLEELSGRSPLVDVVVVTRAGEGLVADVDEQGITVPAGAEGTVGLTISLSEDARASKDWRVVVTSATAPPVVIDLVVGEDEGSTTISGAYWYVLLVLLVIIALFFLLPMIGRRAAREAPEGGQDRGTSPDGAEGPPSDVIREGGGKG